MTLIATKPEFGELIDVNAKLTQAATGFLFTEGLIDGLADVGSVRYCAVPKEEQHYNVVTVAVSRALDPEIGQRAFYTTSSCGVVSSSGTARV